MIFAPAECSQSLPSAWSKCQCVLTRWVTGSAPRTSSAVASWGRDTPIPASINTFPSDPVRTAILPPEPSSTLILFRSLSVAMGDAAALSLIRLTRPRASAKASRGVSQPLVAAYAALPMQHRQNPRRDRSFSGEELMLSSFGAKCGAVHEPFLL